MASTNHVDVSGVLSRLRTFFDKTDSYWIEVDFSHWSNREVDKERVEMLKEAIMDQKAIDFTYLKPYSEIAHRTAYPLKLIFKAKSWYLQGYCLKKQDYRTFKISRMQNMKVLSKSFASKQFYPPSLQISSNGLYSLISITMRFASHVAYRVYDEFDQKDIIQNEDGSLLVSMRLPDDDWLYGFLLSFGTGVQILEPVNIRENLLQRIEEIKKFHTQDIT
jgi:predicted DNA-binding transcriptional regulator YafY